MMLGRVLIALGCSVLAGLSATAGEQRIKGDYLESRTADVYTGPCFSNAQVFINGDQALLAWKVTEGSWNGVKIDGLSIAAAVKATTTFSEDKVEDAKSVLIVDKQATPKQREALIAMAKELAGGRLNNVVAVRDSVVSITVEDHAEGMDSVAEHTAHSTPKAAPASFWAPGIAEISTRPLSEKDHFCGNESVAYEPLSKGVKVLPAYTKGNRYSGEELNTTWNDPNCRSSFVGHFSY